MTTTLMVNGDNGDDSTVSRDAESRHSTRGGIQKENDIPPRFGYGVSFLPSTVKTMCRYKPWYSTRTAYRYGVVVALAVVMFRSAASASASRHVRPVRLAAVRKKQEGRGGYRTTRDAGVLSGLVGQHSSVHGGSTRKGGGIVGI